MAKQLKLFDSKSNPKKEKIKQLQAQVEYHQHLYYNTQPEISDAEFDKLWDELKALDPNNEVFSKVGSDSDPAPGKTSHKTVFSSEEELREYIAKGRIISISLRHGYAPHLWSYKNQMRFYMIMRNHNRRLI